MPRNQDKTPWQGRQSGKSSGSWWTSSTAAPAIHPRGNGASTGDGHTSDQSLLGKIMPKFLRGDR
jgi:hypothetical protein